MNPRNRRSTPLEMVQAAALVIAAFSIAVIAPRYIGAPVALSDTLKPLTPLASVAACIRSPMQQGRSKRYAHQTALALTDHPEIHTERCSQLRILK